MPIAPAAPNISAGLPQAASSADTTATAGIPGLDFASLLQGQIAVQPVIDPMIEHSSEDGSAPVASDGTGAPTDLFSWLGSVLPSIPATVADSVPAIPPTTLPAMVADTVAGTTPATAADAATHGGLQIALDVASGASAASIASASAPSVLPASASLAASASTAMPPASTDGTGETAGKFSIAGQPANLAAVETSIPESTHAAAASLPPAGQSAAVSAQTAQTAATAPAADPNATPPAGLGAAVAPQTVASAPAPGTNAPPAPTHVGTPFHEPAWSQDFGQRIVWLARNEVQQAQVSLNPAHLGPIEIRLEIGGDQANAVFSSPRAEVREALENALPRLREMLAGAGIELGQAHVNSQSQQQGRWGQQASSGPRYGASDNAILSAYPDVNVTNTPRSTTGLGLVDVFA